MVVEVLVADFVRVAVMIRKNLSICMLGGGIVLVLCWYWLRC